MKQLCVSLCLFLTFILQSQNLNFEATGEIPDFFAEDVIGVEHTLSDYLNNDQIVVLEFLNVYCGVCQSYAPQVETFYENYGPTGNQQVTLLGLDISAGSDDEACLDYIEEYNATYPIINGNSTAYYSAEISGTPTFYILFPDGTYTNICSSCQNSSSSLNIDDDLSEIVDNWVAMSMGTNPWGDAPDTDCNATILIEPTTDITLNDNEISVGS